MGCLCLTHDERWPVDHQQHSEGGARSFKVAPVAGKDHQRQGEDDVDRQNQPTGGWSQRTDSARPT